MNTTSSGEVEKYLLTDIFVCMCKLEDFSPIGCKLAGVEFVEIHDVIASWTIGFKLDEAIPSKLIRSVTMQPISHTP